MIPISRLRFDLSLYLVANRPSFKDENLFFSKVMESVKGGASCVQLRDHESDLATTIRTAIRLKDMLKDVPLIINTLHPFEVIQTVGAEGMFLEERLLYSEARGRLGDKVIIGIPVKTMDEVLSAGLTDEIDYLSVKIWPSKKTCPNNESLWGVEGLRSIRARSPHRILAIGGLTIGDAERVYQELNSDDGIAMAGGLMREEDPYITAQRIQAIRLKLRGDE